MTTEEFDRILVSLKHTGGLNIVGTGFVVPLRAVIEILHSNLHQEDKSLYAFDEKNVFIKKPPA